MCFRFHVSGVLPQPSVLCRREAWLVCPLCRWTFGPHYSLLNSSACSCAQNTANFHARFLSVFIHNICVYMYSCLCVFLQVLDKQIQKQDKLHKKCSRKMPVRKSGKGARRGWRRDPREGDRKGRLYGSILDISDIVNKVQQSHCGKHQAIIAGQRCPASFWSSKPPCHCHWLGAHRLRECRWMWLTENLGLSHSTSCSHRSERGVFTTTTPCHCFSCVFFKEHRQHFEFKIADGSLLKSPPLTPDTNKCKQKWGKKSMTAVRELRTWNMKNWEDTLNTGKQRELHSRLTSEPRRHSAEYC